MTGPHVLLLVNSYVTDNNPRRGAKFKLHVDAYRQRGWRVGVIAILQRDYGLLDVVRQGSALIEEEVHGVPIIRDCTQQILIRRVPILRRRYVTSKWGMRGVAHYINKYNKPDIIHAHGSQWAGAVANTVRHSYDIPYVLTEHMSNYVRGEVSRELLPLLRRVFAGADMRVVVSRSLGRDLEGVFGDDSRPWKHVPNMVEDALFDIIPRRCPDLFRFITLSGLTPNKGMDVLLRAFAQVSKRDAVELRIGGDGPERLALERMARSLGIEHQVQFLGYLSREEVMKELSISDACVVASQYETFSIPVIEAHALGMPVVSTRCGGPEELIDESNGVLVPRDDASGLAKGMESVRVRYHQYNSRKIRDDCRARFAPQEVVGQLEAIYSEVLGRPDARADP